MNSYLYGLKKGLPIGLGYLAVSFAFGVMCFNGGITPLMATIISFTNLTSAGQFAGVKMIIQLAGYLEIGLTVLLINLRYALMSISLSQKIDTKTSFWGRILISFGITDEIYALAITEKKEVTPIYVLGLTTLPLIGWSLGTLIGSTVSNLFPDTFLGAMNIALYSMFIAIIVPDAKKSKSITCVILIAIALACLLEYVPYINRIGLGFKTIIATILACVFGALVFPRKDEPSEAIDDKAEVENNV